MYSLSSWLTSGAEAIAVQKVLRKKICIENDFSSLQPIAGVDVSYNLCLNLTRAFIATMDSEALAPIISVKAGLPTTFPYVPGLLSFREVPAVLKALDMLQQKPDILMVDGPMA